MTAAPSFRFAWIDSAPVYIGATVWEFSCGIPEPEKPCRRIFRFSLLGGGQLRVTETWRRYKFDDHESLLPDEPTLTVTAHDGDSVCRHDGKIELNYENGHAEMNAFAAVFLRARLLEGVRGSW
jgi:hypothetical protein